MFVLFSRRASVSCQFTQKVKSYMKEKNYDVFIKSRYQLDGQKFSLYHLYMTVGLIHKNVQYQVSTNIFFRYKQDVVFL